MSHVNMEIEDSSIEITGQPRVMPMETTQKEPKLNKKEKVAEDSKILIKMC